MYPRTNICLRVVPFVVLTVVILLGSAIKSEAALNCDGQ